MKICGKSNIGKVRKENQDCYMAGKTTDGSFWMVLCDGMGGVKAGGEASRMAVQTLEKRFMLQIPLIVDESEIKDFLIKSVRKCNAEIYKKSIVDNKITMGTTIEAAVIRGNKVFHVHCGDSRLYEVTRHKITQLTRDHSMVQELLDCGRITAEEARNHPNKNIITHALGIEQNAELDYNDINMQKGYVLLMCSDGLSNMLLDDEIAHIIRSSDFYSAAGALVDSALERGGTDNITALLAQAE